jgi:predicted AAA+ superfamily ATPase
MEWHYKPRWLTEHIRKAVSFSPIAVLTGARQTGKSTLLQQESPFKNWRYLNLDDLDLLSMAERRPEELLGLSDHLVIDEVQRCPGLLLSVKRAVDMDRKKKFVLSGSANLLLMKSVTESLAGRALYFELLPFSYGEEQEKNFPEWIAGLPKQKPISSAKYVEPIPEFRLFRGSIPPVSFLSDEEQIFSWWRGYIRTYLERDLRDLTQISNLPDFRRMMGLLAMRSGQILKQSEIARDAGLSQATAGRYINLLEVSGLLIKLMPYSKNISKRIVKSPKVYFIDPGLVCALAGFKHWGEIPPSFKGALFESFVCLNLLVLTRVMNGELFYFRTQGGKEKEVDFVLEMNGRIIGLEVKYSTKVGFQDAENLLFLRDLLPNWGAGFVIHNGPEVLTLARDIHAVPWALI